MNKKYGICSKILVLVLLLTSLLVGCKSGGPKTPKDEVTVTAPRDNTTVMENVKQAEKIFHALNNILCEDVGLLEEIGRITKSDRREEKSEKQIENKEDKLNYT